ncbi:hypothetical protein KY285_011484 [Solanum tuberosum]|nr:hypothetical protein KY285_011484 [Solanum tuberosum]
MKDHVVVSGTKRVRENANEKEEDVVEVGSGSGSDQMRGGSNVTVPDFPEEEFKKAFHMGKATFDFICSELESVVTKKRHNATYGDTCSSACSCMHLEIGYRGATP